MAHLEASIPAERRAALDACVARQGSMRPREPHWYLSWMGVRPEAQGTGLGTTPLGLGLARADAQHMPAYLEATNYRNAELFARHGFEAIGVVPAPGNPKVIPMWRPARRCNR